MAKKYFWLKIQEEFFRQKEIKALRKMEKGPLYILIYQKMLVYSLQNNSKIYFDNVEDSFEEEIALVIDEDVEDVKETLLFLKRTNLIEYVSADEMELLQVQELTGEESDSAKRVRKHRENKKKDSEKEKKSKEESFKEENLDCNATETSCNKNVTLEKEKELELDKEIEQELEPKIKDSQVVSLASVHQGNENLKKITKLYEQNIGPIYPANRQWFMEICDKIDWQLFERAVQICIDNGHVTPSYLKGIIRRCISENIKTLDKFNAKRMEFINSKSQKSEKKPAGKFAKYNNFVKEEIIDEEMLKEIEMMEAELGVS